MKNRTIKNRTIKIISLVTILALVALATAGCGSKESAAGTEKTVVSETDEVTPPETTSLDASEEAGSTSTEIIMTNANTTSNGAIDATGIFTERDLSQNADLTNAEYITLQSGKDISITGEGIYVLSGEAEDITVMVEAGDNDKVQIVLDNASIKNGDSPAIYVKNADKVFVTTTSGSENSLSVTGSFVPDGENNLDAVIYSKDDLILNGLGSLYIYSTDNGVSAKDDLKITGGSITIDAVSDALEANDSIAVADGTISIKTSKDGFHAENTDDNTKGYIYICGGDITIDAADDAIYATTILQIDGGNITVNALEGLEATYVQVNGGEIKISASDDGINASEKSTPYYVIAEFNGGYITITMGAGDTDAVDSNGNLYVNGGTLNINAQSPFDYDGYAAYNGGTIIVNGVETNTISNSMMGGMMGGGGMMGPGGQGGQGGWGGPGGQGTAPGFGG